VVQAFAGAGKTRLAIELAERFLRDPGLRVGQRLLFISFSTASCIRAAETLRRSAIPSDDVEICTFHAFAFRLVRKYAGRLGLQGPICTGTRRTTAGTHLDFDGLLFHAEKLLHCPDVAALLPEAYPLVIVDEFQDTSPPLLAFLKSGFVGKSVVRCFGDAFQRIQPDSIDFDPHAAAVAEGAEEYQLDPISGFSRYETFEIASLARAFVDGCQYRGASALVSFQSVPSGDEPLAHAICWDALDSISNDKSCAVICFNNAEVGRIADLLGESTPKRKSLRIVPVASKELVAAQDELFVSLLRHWCAPTAETERLVVDVLALLAVGGRPDHRHLRVRARKLDEAKTSGRWPVLPTRVAGTACADDAAEAVKLFGQTAASLGEVVASLWKSSAWCVGGLRSAAGILSQSVPDGLILDDVDSVERLARAWDQARRWRTAKDGRILAMTVNQSKNREFDDVFVYVDGFSNELRGPITLLGRMQMYVAVSRGRRRVKVIYLDNHQAKRADLLTAVLPKPERAS
jgi:hypothetical protein